jgi:hypothetical protein
VVGVQAGYHIQRGRTEVNGLTEDVSIDAVASTNRAFLLLGKGSGYYDGNQDSDEVCVRGAMTATDTVYLARQSAGNSTWVGWQVIACDDGEFLVYRGSGNMAVGEWEDLVTLPDTVETNASVAWVTADSDQNNRNEYCESELIAMVTNSTTLRVVRASATGAAINYNWVVVVFDTNKIDALRCGWTTVTTQQEGSPRQVAIDPVDPDCSLLLFQNTSTYDSGIPHSAMAGRISASNQLEFYQHISGAGGTQYIQFYVIDFGNDAEARRGMIDYASNANWYDANISLTPTVDVARTIAFHCNSCDGNDNGKAYPRPFATSLLTSTNLWIHRNYNGQASYIQWQVLELPGEPVPPPPPATNYWDGSWTARRPLTTAGGAGTTLRLSLDSGTTPTAPQIYDQCRPDGADLRIAYWNGASWTELDRDLRIFTTNAIEVFFQLQSGGVSTNHYLVYGNPNATNPPADIDGIYAFYDDMETDRGWTHGGSEDEWERSGPRGLGGDDPSSNPPGNADPTADHTSGSGTNCWGQDLTGQGAFAGNYENSGDSWLRSPAINCSGLTNVQLSFWRWLNVEGNTYDQAYVEVSDDASSWTTAWAAGNTWGERVLDSGWSNFTYDISAVADQESTVYIRFRIDSDYLWTYSGWNVDDVSVYAAGEVSAVGAAQTGWNDDWSEGWNWSLRRVPGTADTVFVDGPFLHGPEVDEDEACARLYLGSGSTDLVMTLTGDLRVNGTMDIGGDWQMTGNGGSLTVLDPLTIDRSLTLSDDFVLTNDADIAVNGAFSFSGGCHLRIGGTMTVTGTLSLAAADGVSPTISALHTHFGLRVMRDGRIGVNGAVFDGLDAQGLNIQDGAAVDDLDGIEFVNGQSGCTYLNMETLIGRYNFSLCSFDTNCQYNVATPTNGTIIVNMVNAYGDRAGDAYENEGVGTQINWTNYKQWLGGHSGDETNWHQADNWLPVGVPSGTNDILIPDTGYDCTVFNGSGGVCRNIEISDGTLRLHNHDTLTVNGYFYNSSQGSFVPADNTVVFAGAADAIVDSGGDTFGSLVISKPGSTLTMLAGLSLTGTGTVANGTLDCGSSMLTLSSGMVVRTQGTLALSGQGAVALMPDEQLEIDGTFRASHEDARVQRADTNGWYAFTFNSGAALNIRGLKVSGADTNGLRILPGAEMLSLNDVHFSGVQPGGRHLSVLRGSSFTGTFYGCTFDDSFGTGNNVFADGGGQTVLIRMGNYSGTGGGEGYDREVNGANIVWTRTVVWEGKWSYRRNLSVPAAPTNYTARVRFDGSTTPTAAEVYSRCRTDGYDVRIGYWTGSAWRELDREVVHFSSSTVEVYFAKQQAAASTNYYLFYGNPDAGIGPVSLTAIYAFGDDFERDRGWTHGGTRDDWQRTVPLGLGGDDPVSVPPGYPDPVADHTPEEGTQCWGNDLTGLGTYPGNYEDNADNWLRTPAIDCSSLTGVHIAVWRYLNYEGNTWDQVYVQASQNGFTWNTVWSEGFSSGVRSINSNWVHLGPFDISSVADNDSSVYVRFRMDADGAWTYSGWNVDDFKLFGAVEVSAVGAEREDWNARWADGWNWVGRAVPGSNDAVVVDGYLNAPVVDVPAICAGLAIGAHTSSLITVSSDLTISGDLRIGPLGRGRGSGGDLNIQGGLVLATGGVFAAAGGAVDVAQETQLNGFFALTNARMTAQCDTLVGGTLRLVGQSAYAVGADLEIHGRFESQFGGASQPAVYGYLTHCGFTVHDGGALYINGLTCSNLNRQGLQVRTGASITDIDNLDFVNGPGNGVYLNLGVLSGGYSFMLCTFDAGCATNVSTEDGGSIYVNMINAGGARGVSPNGELYDHDGSGSQINWTYYKQWVGGTAGQEEQWNCADNWLPTGIPSAGQDVLIPEPAGAWTCVVSDASGGECRTLQISDGTLELRNNRILTVNGDFLNSVAGTFRPLSGILQMAGGIDQDLSPAGDNLDRLSIDKNAGDVVLKGCLTVTGLTHVISGRMDPGTHPVTVQGGMTIETNGAYVLANTARLEVGDDAAVLVNGLLEASGNPVITHSGSGRYGFAFGSNGVANIRNLNFSYADTNGLVLQAGTQIQNLNHVLFSQAASGGRHLSIYRGASATNTLSGCEFDSSFGTGSGHNVFADGNGNTVLIRMSNYGGTGSGEDFDDETAGATIVWTRERTWNGNWNYRRPLTIPAGSTNRTLRIRLDSSTVPSANSVHSLCRSDGHDLRIGYRDGDEWRDLDRDLVCFGADLIEIYFARQDALASTDNYYLYFGNASADAAPETLADIYHFADDMETDRGWTHAGTHDDWQRDVPQGIGSADPQSLPDVGWVDPSEDHTPQSGTRCWGNDLTGINTIAGDYENYADNRLQSPAIDCSVLSDTRMACWRWLNVRDNDNACLQISDNGSSWTTIWTNTGENSVEDRNWTNQLFDISSIADGENTVYLRYMLSADGSGRWAGWNIDDFRIYAYTDVSDVGAQETDWRTQWSQGWNWLPRGVPSTNDDIFIVDAVNMPEVEIPAACASLTLTGSAPVTLTLSTGLTVYGNTSIAPGGTLNADGNTFTAEGNIVNRGVLSVGNVLNLSGNLFNYGTFSNNNGLVNFLGSSTLGGNQLITFNDVNISNSLTAINGNIAVKGDWCNHGTFFPNGGTVIFNGNAGQAVESGGSEWTEIRINNASTGGVSFIDGFTAARFIDTTPGSRLFFQWQDDLDDVFEITDSGGLVLSGSTEEPIILRRYGGSDALTNLWEIYPSAGDGVWSVSGVDVSYSVNTASNYINPAGASIDSGRTFNWFVPLYIQLADIYAVGYTNPEVIVGWVTATEVNNMGFNVYRAMTETGTYVQINERIIPGLGSTARGMRYEFSDTAVTNGGTYWYKVDAVEFDGRAARYGPVSAHPGLDADADGMSDDWEAQYGVDDPSGNPDGDAWSNLQEFLNGTDPNESDQPGIGSGYGPGAGSTGDSGIYKLTVITSGIYRLTADWLQAQGGITNLDTWTIGHVHIYNRGSEIPLYIRDAGGPGFGTNDYIEFYGESIDDVFTDRNIYWLHHGTGASRRVYTKGLIGGTAVSNFRYTARLEKSVDYIPDIPDTEPDDDHWFMDECYDGETNRYAIFLPHVTAPATQAVLRVEMQGLTLDHHAVFAVNGTPVGNMRWNGYEKVQFATNISPALLVSGTNEIAIGFPGDTGMAWEDTLINWIEVKYTRDMNAEDNRLSVPAAVTATNAFHVTGFTGSEISVYTIIDATNVARVTNAVVSGSGPYSVDVAAEVRDNSLTVLTADDAVLKPAGIWEDASSDLRSVTNGADYIIITYDPWQDDVLPLATNRAAQGLRVRVVGVQDVYDDFNHGIFSPYALREFLCFTRTDWQPPAPKYVLLVGDGTYDYRDHYGLGDMNYVPTKLLHGLDYGETASDNWLVCLDGADDFVPDMYLGRMPARTTGDVQVMVRKTLDYETLGVAGWTNVLLVSDEQDGDTSFEYLNVLEAQSIPDTFSVEHIRLANFTNRVEARTNLSAEFNSGPLLISYAGHGSTEQWADPPALFDVDDITVLTNAVRQPLVMTPTCMNGYFIWPQGDGYECLGEALIRTNGRGAVACFSPSAFGLPPNQEVLMSELMQMMFAQGQDRLGPAVTAAKHILAQAGGEDARNLVQTFVLFGDPALRLNIPDGVADTSTPRVVAWSPDLSSGATTGQPLVITFSKAMDPVAVRAAWQIMPLCDGTGRTANESFTFNPANGWQQGVTYTVTIDRSAADLAGNVMTAGVSFVFAVDRRAVSGGLSYTGLQHGAIYVIASDTASGWSTNNSVRLWDIGPYAFSIPDTGDRWIKAWRDANKNSTCDTWEAQGVYTLNPVSHTTALSGVDIEMQDPHVDTDGDGLTDYAEVNVYFTDPDNPDEDVDGLNDSREIANKTDPRAADSDSDGMNDGDEIIAGTSPLNSNEVFRMLSEQLVAEQGIVIMWNSETGRWYDVQAGQQQWPCSLVWSTVIQNIVGTGTDMGYTNATVTNRWYFYRVLVTTNSP